MYLAIVRVENNRVAKFMEFPDHESAQSHVDEHGGFVWQNETQNPINVLWVDGAAVSVVGIPRTEQNVRDECARRLMWTFGARDQGHLERLLNEATMDAVELMSIGADNWDVSQQTRAAQLNAGRALVKAHDVASKTLRAMSPIPDDYADDKYWP